MLSGVLSLINCKGAIMSKDINSINFRGKKAMGKKASGKPTKEAIKKGMMGGMGAFSQQNDFGTQDWGWGGNWGQEPSGGAIPFGTGAGSQGWWGSDFGANNYDWGGSQGWGQGEDTFNDPHLTDDMGGIKKNPKPEDVGSASSKPKITTIAKETSKESGKIEEKAKTINTSKKPILEFKTKGK